MLTALELTLHQLVALVAPTLCLAVALHLIERARSRVASRRWGWGAVLVTAWLGTPLHEVAHAVVHKLFGHEVRKVALFEPDPRTGCLGYVEYAHDPRSVPQTVGRFFAGVAPLVAGTLAVWLLATALLDATAWLPTGSSARAIATATSVGDGLVAFARVARNTVGALTDPSNLASPRFWVFMLLSTCVVSHMGPSRSDLEGAGVGALLLVAVMFAVNLVASVAGASGGGAVRAFVTFAAPVVGLLAFAVTLSLVVLGVTAAASLVTGLVRDRVASREVDAEGYREEVRALVVVLLTLLVLVWIAPPRRPQRPRRAHHEPWGAQVDTNRIASSAGVLSVSDAPGAESR